MKNMNHQESRNARMLPVTAVNRLVPQMREIAQKHNLEIFEHEEGGLYLVKNVQEWLNRPKGVEEDAAYSGFDLFEPEEEGDAQEGYEAMIWGKIPENQKVCFDEIKAMIEKKLKLEVYTDIF